MLKYAEILNRKFIRIARSSGSRPLLQFSYTTFHYVEVRANEGVELQDLSANKNCGSRKGNETSMTC